MATLGAWVSSGAHPDIVELVLGHVLGTGLRDWTDTPRVWHAVTRCVSKAFTECLTRTWENSESVPHDYFLLLQKSCGSWHTYALRTGVYFVSGHERSERQVYHLTAPKTVQELRRAGCSSWRKQPPIDNNARLALLETGICIDTRKAGSAHVQNGRPGHSRILYFGQSGIDLEAGQGFRLHNRAARAGCTTFTIRICEGSRWRAARMVLMHTKLQLFPNTSRRARLRVHPRAPWNAGHAHTARGPCMKWLRVSQPDRRAFVRVRAMITRWARKLCKEPVHFLLDDLGFAHEHAAAAWLLGKNALSSYTDLLRRTMFAYALWYKTREKVLALPAATALENVPALHEWTSRFSHKAMQQTESVRQALGLKRCRYSGVSSL